MKKLFILFILCLLLFSCSQDNQTKKTSTWTKNNIVWTWTEEKKELDFGLDIPDWDFKKYESITKVDFWGQKTFFYNTFTWTSACGSPYTELKLMENWVRKDIYKWKFCIPEVKKIDDDKAWVYFCYWSWAWSWECWAAFFEYSIESNSWRFLDEWLYALDWGNKNLKKFPPYDIIDEDFVELLDYMNESWYNLDLSLVKDKVKKELKKK